MDVANEHDRRTVRELVNLVTEPEEVRIAFMIGNNSEFNKQEEKVGDTYNRWLEYLNKFEKVPSIISALDSLNAIHEEMKEALAQGYRAENCTWILTTQSSETETESEESNQDSSEQREEISSDTMDNLEEITKTRYSFRSRESHKYYNKPSASLKANSKSVEASSKSEDGSKPSLDANSKSVEASSKSKDVSKPRYQSASKRTFYHGVDSLSTLGRSSSTSASVQPLLKSTQQADPRGRQKIPRDRRSASSETTAPSDSVHANNGNSGDTRSGRERDRPPGKQALDHPQPDRGRPGFVNLEDRTGGSPGPGLPDRPEQDSPLARSTKRKRKSTKRFQEFFASLKNTRSSSTTNERNAGDPANPVDATFNSRENRRENLDSEHENAFENVGFEEDDDDDDDCEAKGAEAEAEACDGDDDADDEKSESNDKKKRRSTRRATLTPPKSFIQVKDDTAARVFEVAARKVKELQISTTWAEVKDIEEKPKVQFILMCYDEMITEPLKAFNSRYRRKVPQFSFLVPRGFDPKTVGEKLVTIGKEMKTGATSGRNWKIVDDIKGQHMQVFGHKGFRINGIGRGKRKDGKDRKQAARWHPEYGRGYERNPV